jgi:polysaccharide chain length determinant protein (PEP-CTERM system associated)
MVEDFDEKPMESWDLEQYCALVRRRRWHILMPLFLGWLVVCGASWVLPSVYKSGTLILVEQPIMPKDYVVPNVSDIQDRLQSITQQILSRTSLLHIIDDLNLYARERKRLTSDELVGRMRKDISIELVRDDRSHELTAFNVYYSSHDPHVAQLVTRELTGLFISENLEVRRQESEETTKFLESQMEEARKTLADQDEKAREFKYQHSGELPAQLGTNLQILSGLQSQLQNQEQALDTAKQQSAYLQSLLGDYETRRGSGNDATSLELSPLGKLKAQLADLRSHYTDHHPDVRKLKEQIAEIEEMQKRVSAEEVDSGGVKIGANPDLISGANADLGSASPLVQLKGQLRANQVDISNRNLAIASLQARINQYQSRLNQEPVVEQQFADLSRGYDQSKANYDDLLKKKNQSAMATSLELRQQDEHFRIIDPPSLPVKPDFPNHLKFCALGLGVGLALAGLVASGAELLDDRLHSGKTLKGLLPVAVLAEVPVIANPVEQEAEKKSITMAWATTGLVFTSILGGFALSYLRG